MDGFFLGFFFIFPLLLASVATHETLHAPSTLMWSSTFVKEEVAESLISVEHMPTTMLVDPLTKCLPICVFQEHVTHMGLLGA